MKVKIALYLTTSKFAAYLILIIGSTYGFVYKDSNVLLATFSAVSAILIMKTYVTGKTEQHRQRNDYQNDYQRPNSDEVG